jgi:hypothetical protein
MESCDQFLFNIVITHTYLRNSASVSTGNTFQDPLRLRETTDNTERYI